NAAGVALLHCQNEDVVNLGSSSLSDGQPDFVQPRLAVLGVFQPPQAKRIVDARIKWNIAEDLLGGAAEPFMEVCCGDEPAEEGVRDLQVKPLRTGEVD